MDVLLKASLVSALFYICYSLFLRNETFFQSNRAFLNIGLLLTLILPWIVIPVYITKPAPVLSLEGLDYVQSVQVAETSGYMIGWEELLIGAYVLGILILSIKLLIEIFSLRALIRTGKRTSLNKSALVEIKEEVSPFSFFNSIVYNPDSFDKKELAQIIEHEKVHVRQGHSYDILFVRIICILNWFNPLIWLYKSAVEQNLEFIADQEARRVSEISSFYPRLLLNSAAPQYRLLLANNFFNSLIKKRIVMLQKQRSNRKSQLKMIFILPLMALFLMSFSTKEIVTYEVPESEINSGLMQESEVLPGETIEVIVSKDMSDKDLDKLVDKFKKMDISLKFKGVKRNSDGEIKAIQISVKSDRSNANYSSNSDDGINPITIKVDDGSISIGDGEYHEVHGGYKYRTKDDGTVWIHKGDKSSEVHVYTDHGDEDFEIHEEDGKVIIKSGGKVKEIKKVGKGNAFFIKEGDGDHEYKVVEIEGGDHEGHEVIVRSGKDAKLVKEWIDKKEGNVFILDDEDKEKVVIRNIGKDKIHIMGDSEDALIILDGKEVDNDKVSELDSKNIKSVEVLKGKAAEEKYGEKGKNGVIVIKTKE